MAADSNFKSSISGCKYIMPIQHIAKSEVGGGLKVVKQLELAFGNMMITYITFLYSSELLR